MASPGRKQSQAGRAGAAPLTCLKIARHSAKIDRADGGSCQPDVGRDSIAIAGSELILAGSRPKDRWRVRSTHRRGNSPYDLPRPRLTMNQLITPQAIARAPNSPAPEATTQNMLSSSRSGTSDLAIATSVPSGRLA